MFRINTGDSLSIYVKSLREIVRVLQGLKPGRYQIAKLHSDPFTSGKNERPWGVGVTQADGSIAVEADPLETSWSPRRRRILG